MSVLEAHDLSIRFGGVQANLDVSIAVDEYDRAPGRPPFIGKVTDFDSLNVGKESARLWHHNRMLN